jgi:hypothetical protein
MQFILFIFFYIAFFKTQAQIFLPPYQASSYSNRSVSKIELTADKLALYPWDTAHLTAIVYNANGIKLNEKKITWSSSDSITHSVDQKGNVTSNLLGNSTIKASVEGISASINIATSLNTSYYVSKNIMLDSLGSWAETSITINPQNPLNIVASSNSANFCSFDGGRNWKVNPIGEAWADPNVFFSYNGELFRQGMEGASSTQRGIKVLKSINGGLTFSSNSWAYKPNLNSPGNIDQPMMCIDNSNSSSYKGNIYVIGSDYPQGTPTYSQKGFSLILVKSADNGSTWSSPIDISTCLKCGQEHSSKITTGSKGEVYAAWWNGENNIVFSSSTDGGKTWGNNIIAHSYTVRSNPYVRSDDVRGNINIEVDKSGGPFDGTIYLSSIDQNNINGGAADAWVKSSSDGGKTWTTPIYLSNGPKGPFKYYFQPSISVAPNGRLDAVWYDTRNWSGNDINSVTYDLYYTYSTNGGKSFNSNVRITPISSIKKTNCANNVPCGERHLYEYIEIKSDNYRAMPVWTNIGSDGKSKPTFATIWIKP